MPIDNIREEVRLGSLRVIDVPGMHARIPVVAVRRAGGYRSQAATDFLSVLTAHPPGLASDAVPHDTAS